MTAMGRPSSYGGAMKGREEAADTMRASARAEVTPRDQPVVAEAVDAPSLEAILSRLPREMVEADWFDRSIIRRPLRLRATFRHAPSIEAMADRIEAAGAEIHIDLCRKEELVLPPAGGMENMIDIVALEAPERWYEKPPTPVEQARF